LDEESTSPVKTIGSESDSDGGNAKTKRPLRRQQSNTEVAEKLVDMQTQTQKLPRLPTPVKPVIQSVTIPVVTQTSPASSNASSNLDDHQKLFLVCFK
jgi:hypothetical protein